MDYVDLKIQRLVNGSRLPPHSPTHHPLIETHRLSTKVTILLNQGCVGVWGGGCVCVCVNRGYLNWTSLNIYDM